MQLTDYNQQLPPELKAKVSELDRLRKQAGIPTTGTAATADYPDIPDEGVLCADGAYVNFTTTDVTAFTVFFN